MLICLKHLRCFRRKKLCHSIVITVIQYSESITDISAMVGFNNYTHFYWTFKAQTGLNPAEYKEKIFAPKPLN